MSDFADALFGNTEDKNGQSLRSLFDPLIGEWDFEWIDGKGTEDERHVVGEWLFSKILNGAAVQDVFICPSRKERLTNPQPDAEYGTTVRFFNAKKNKWDICYGYDGTMTVLEAEPFEDKIILTNQDRSEGLNQWVFSDIGPLSFHWQNRTSFDDGNTWRVNGELYAKRRTNESLR